MDIHTAESLDQILAELIKAGYDTLCSEIHKLICSMRNKEELLQQWKESIIVLIHKKSNKTDCNNFNELHNLYSSPNIVRVIKSSRIRWVGHVACMGEGRGVYRVLVARPKGKRPLGRHRWGDNIRWTLGR
jgi:hypothetical protein